MLEKMHRQLLSGGGTIRHAPRPSHCSERHHDGIAAEPVHKASPGLACELGQAVEASPEPACELSHGTSKSVQVQLQTQHEASQANEEKILSTSATQTDPQVVSSAALLRVIQILLEIKQQQRVHHRRVLRLLERQSERLERLEALTGAASILPARSPVAPPKLPAESIEEVEVAEEALKDESVSIALHRQLARLRGSSFKEVATGVMKAIMTPTVQRLYSLHGKKGKKAFLTTRLCKVATDVCEMQQGVDVADVHAFMRRWLPGSCDRGGGRKRRFEDALLLPGPHGLVQSTSTPEATNHLPAATATSSLGTGAASPFSGTGAVTPLIGPRLQHLP